LTAIAPYTQVLGPVVETDAELLVDEQCFEARAVDEEIAVDLATVVERQTRDESVRATSHFRDPPFGALQPTRLGIPAQIARDMRGIDVQCVVRAADRRVASVTR
jgi:hypothetical protein